MGCTQSNAVAGGPVAEPTVAKKPADLTRQDTNGSARSSISSGSAAGNGDARRRLSMTGGPSGNTVIPAADDARRRRLSIAAQPRAATEAIVESNKQTTVAGDMGTGGPAAGVSAAALPVTWGTYSRPGNDPVKQVKENQDSYVVQDKFGGDASSAFFGVFDGHGPNGAFASQYVRDHLPAAIVTPTLRTDPFLAISKACLTTNQDLSISPAVDVYVSGSTAITGYLHVDTLYVANVGDSRAVLGRQSKRGGLKALDLSNDQKPDRPDEMARIIASGGRVFDWGVSRVWLQDMEIPGLAMSRSFGDLAAETVGVFAEPELSEVKLTEVDKFVILASDGVWEFITSQEAVNIVAEHMEAGPQAACEALVRESTARWQEEEDVVDDTTCIVIFLNYK